MSNTLQISPASAITIHDVARVAGVSIKTVSRVLRDEPYVADATRATVHRVAQQLGYVPHPSARNLASSVSNVIALVTLAAARGTHSQAGHEYLMGLQMGVLSVCQALDFGLMLVAIPRQTEAAIQEMQHRVKARQVGGFIIAPPACDLPCLLSTMDAAGLRYAAISPSSLECSGPWVAANESDAVRRLTLHLVDAGHRRIALLLGDPGSRGAVERLAGYRDALTERGIAYQPAWVEQAGFAFDRGREAAHRLLKRTPQPTAILAANDDCAAGVIAAAHERGMTLPDDLSVTGYDDVDLARKVWPGLTTVRQPLEELAAVATRQLIALMQPNRRTGDTPPMHVTLQTDLVLRGSVSAPASGLPQA